MNRMLQWFKRIIVVKELRAAIAELEPIAKMCGIIR